MNDRNYERFSNIVMIAGAFKIDQKRSVFKNRTKSKSDYFSVLGIAK